MKVALLALVATAGVLVAAADVDYGLCYNEVRSAARIHPTSSDTLPFDPPQAYNTATNDVYNDIVVQAQVDLNAGPQAYDPYGAALWNDFYGSVYPGCEEGELYEVTSVASWACPWLIFTIVFAGLAGELRNPLQRAAPRGCKGNLRRCLGRRHPFSALQEGSSQGSRS